MPVSSTPDPNDIITLSSNTSGNDDDDVDIPSDPNDPPLTVPPSEAESDSPNDSLDLDNMDSDPPFPRTSVSTNDAISTYSPITLQRRRY